MPDTDSSQPATSHSNARFATTHWTVVLAAGSPDSSRYREALETLCQSYWYPLYAYLRRTGYDTHQAEDHTQGFFASLMEKQGLRRVDPKRGRFRSYLLGAFKHYVADQHDREQALKRGGRRDILPLDFYEAETRYSVEAASSVSPEELFTKSWALLLLGRTLLRLRDEAVAASQEHRFEHLKTFLTGDNGSLTYRSAAERLGMTDGAVRTAVHRLRRRYQELLRDEIARTVSTPDEIDAEIRDLFDACSS